MDIGVPLRELGAYNIDALRTAIALRDEAAWLDNTHRQQAYDVHQMTHSLVMIFTDTSQWPALEVQRQKGWDLLAESALPLMHQILADHYPLGPGGVIKPHRDSHPSFHYGHRIHVPVVSNPRVRFMLDGRPYKLEVGQAYEINNQLTHSVMNKGVEARIHFIFDYVPPQQLGREVANA
jgi:hypothetical protein